MPISAHPPHYAAGDVVICLNQISVARSQGEMAANPPCIHSFGSIARKLGAIILLHK